jgi:hypothetical protein
VPQQWARGASFALIVAAVARDQVHVLTNMSLRLTTQRPKSSQRRRCMLPSGGHWQLGCWDWARCLLSTLGIEIRKAAGLDLAEIHQGSCPLAESPQAPLLPTRARANKNLPVPAAAAPGASERPGR